MAEEQTGTSGASGSTNTTDTGATVPETKTSLTDTGKQADTGTEGKANQDKGVEGKDKAAEGDKGTDKQADKDAKAPVIPEKYDLKLPEGVLVDETMMAEFTALGKEQKWTNETAQKMADIHLKAVGVFAQKQAAEFNAKVEGWSNELINDKDLGGAKIDDSMKQARKVIALAATVPGINAQRLLNDLNSTGMHTHSDLVRLFHYFGQFIGEDNKFIKGNPVSSAPKDAATILYGETGVKQS